MTRHWRVFVTACDPDLNHRFTVRCTQSQLDDLIDECSPYWKAVSVVRHRLV